MDLEEELAPIRYYEPLGNTDDSGDGDTSDDDTDDDADDDDSGDGDTSDDDLKAENDRLKAALKKANKQAQAKRLAAKDGESKPDPVADLTKELRVRDAIEALRDAEAIGKAPRLRKLVPLLDSIEPDEIEGAIADLKKEYPELFAKKGGTNNGRQSPRIRRGTSADGDGKDTKRPEGLSETSKKMLGRR